ncbi:FAD-linked oxidase C-terminal domain-containing protein [Dactylosporangium sp. NPDC005555]|uniref:FAD-linked oxidase C-terminal domain-containing protein n=1 Tax=Dactylosporangium sp. NPDC005555 TaxID=3154889 RepID=UPI0033AF3894
MASWRERSWWGWGWADEALDDDACRRLAETSLRPWMPIDGSVLPVPYDPVLPPPRLIPPSIMQEAFAADAMTRAAHTYGKAFRDVVRALHGRLDHPPDLVCFPRTAHDVVATLDWAEAVGAAVVPYGGGTSVVGGVEYRGDAPWISLDLGRLNRIGDGASGDQGVWRSSFLRAPYTRDALIRLGLIVETVETACTWTRFEALHAAVTAAAQAAAPARVAVVTCRITHAYPDGPAPYFTVITPARRGAEVTIWDEIKAEVSSAITAAGGTITHHHAVGRDHLPWLARDPLFTDVLRAAKRTLDPRGILNPGALLLPQ